MENNLTTTLNWISVIDRLPEIPIHKPSYLQYVKVIGRWGNQWSQFSYVRKKVRNEYVERFEWNGRLNTFPIEYCAILEL
jgi:hypothetical protein